MDDLVEAIERLADCIYKTNQLLTEINKKIDEFTEGIVEGFMDGKE